MVSNTSNTPPGPTFVEFCLDWTVKGLGLVVAIFFGIWAPISFKETQNGNKSNDQAQDDLKRSFSSMMKIQSSAASEQQSIQRSVAVRQSDVLESMNSRYSAIGEFQVAQFCLTMTDYAPCRTFTAASRLPSLVSYLGGITTIASPTLTSDISSRTSQTSSSYGTGAPPPVGGSSGSSGKSGSLTTGEIVGVAIGALFAIIALISASGMLVWRHKQRRALRKM